MFDLDCFYSRQVPILALQSPLIMFSACAFAARQLSMTSRRLPQPDSWQTHTQIDLTTTQGRDYTWIAEAYYDAAISLLRQHTSDIAAQDLRSTSLPMHDADTPTPTHRENASPFLNNQNSPRARLRDESVIAVTILSCYEFLGGAAPNWSDHLDGIWSFLRLSDEAGLLDFGPPSPIPDTSLGPSRLIRAAFWNFARQDMLAACKSRLPPLIGSQ